MTDANRRIGGALGKPLADRAAASPAEPPDLVAAIHERITVAGPEIVGVPLPAAAYAHGLAPALPEKL